MDQNNSKYRQFSLSVFHILRDEKYAEIRALYWKKERKVIKNFLLNYFAGLKKNILVILMSKVFLTTKNSGKP